MPSLKATTLISLLLLLILLVIPDEALSQRRGRRGNATDMPGDTLPPLPGDSLRQTTTTTDSIPKDSIALQPEKKKQLLDAPIVYEASDSIVIDFRGGGTRAHLYGNSKADYENVKLTAAIISLDMDSNTLYARGVTDSLEVITGKPVFTDGDTPYETNTIRYNLKSKKAFISDVITQQGEGYVVGRGAKKGTGDELYMINGRYTTCDHHDHPHFYFQLTRAKVKPKKNVVTGPAYLVVEDVPLPIAVPFFYFPFTSSYSSGFIMPSYMDDSDRGFGLTGGGYYFAISDQMDLKLLGDIYTKGSWAMGAETNYVKRYKYSGALQTFYQVTKTGDKAVPEEYLVVKDFKLVWSHRKDPKASPNTTFSANVNFSTSSYEQKNVGNYYNPALTTQNTKTSSISYTRQFPEQNLNISSTFNIAQTLRDSSIAVTMPDLNISLSKIYPFKRKKAVGQDKWYEKISIGYTGRLTNSIKTKDDMLFKSNLIKDWNNGMQHTIPISATFTLFNYFNVTPSINYTERWYTRKVMQDWSPEENRMVATDTVYGFHRVYNYSGAVSVNTKIYGMYKPLLKFAKNKGVTIRHIITPEISFSGAPDFGSPRYGYYETVNYTDASGIERSNTYSPYGYTGTAFSPPGRGKSGTVSFGISNNLEMKYTNKNDSVVKKSLIDEFGAKMSYNLANDTTPWSDLSLSLRLKLTKSYTLSFNGTFATYAYQFDEKGNVYTGNRTEYSYGRFGRFKGWGSSFNYTFSNDTWKKWFGKGEETDNKPPGEQTDEPPGEGLVPDEEEGITGKKVRKAVADADGYQAFSMPWSFNVSYSFNISEDRTKPINPKSMRYPYKYTHNINGSGNIKLSNKWSASFSTGYDFEAKEITQTTFNLSRDLHCWNIAAYLSPFGRYKSYNITLRASASLLQDLKYEQKSQTYSNVQWY